MAKKRIAITGGIGSGKSTIVALLRKMNYAVFSCDEIYAELVKSKAYIEKIQTLFPAVVKNGAIDKQCLAEIVFSNVKNRKKLNEIAHPLIMQTLFKRMDECDGVVFAEVPLLFEGNYQSQFDGIIVVVRDSQKRLEAIMERDCISETQAKQRLDAQFDYDSPLAKEIFSKNQTFLLDNNLSQNKLTEKVLEILQKLRLSLNL